MMVTAGLLIWSLLAASTSQSPAQRLPSTGELTAEELQAIVVALNETGLREARRFAQGERRESAVAVVSDSTLGSCVASGTVFCIREGMHSTIARLLGGVHSPLAATFAARNVVSSSVPPLGERIALIPSSELDVVFRQGGGWQEFRGRFGTAGLVQFSAPAIEGDQAAVYVVFGCGGLCGKSWLVTLERRRGGFRVRKSQILTIS
jgi:hypothetical protein